MAFAIAPAVRRPARPTNELQLCATVSTPATLSRGPAPDSARSPLHGRARRPHAKLKLTVLGGLAEFERALIRARAVEGRSRAEARGVHMGRPRALARHQREEALAALAKGAATQADLARRFSGRGTRFRGCSDDRSHRSVSFSRALVDTRF